MNSGSTGFDPVRATAAEIAAAVKSGAIAARAVTDAHLARIATHDARIGAFTDLTATRARAEADAVDGKRARGEALGPLAGVPYAVKNLFDVAGLATRAGSKINRDDAPAAADATLVARLKAADAVLLGALNMGEYAYDFTGENAHDGPSRNPHDTTRMTGGSSGGSGAAAAAGFASLTLGSDTNGSIRVPASLCGLFGFKPTYGRLSRAGTFPFVGSLDHVGPLARSVADCALAYDAMAGHDPADPVCADLPATPLMPELARGIDGLRIAIATGHFAQNGFPEAFAAVRTVASTLDVTREVALPEATRARGAAYLVTATEGAALHLARLKSRAADFDPDVRDRLIAGAMVPAAWVAQAQKVRRAFAACMAAVFAEVDVLLAPATPCPAPAIGQKTFELDGRTLPVRPNLGVFTQPFSFVGLPVMSVPLVRANGAMPIGVQIVAAPWREDVVVCVAAELERRGIVAAPVASLD